MVRPSCGGRQCLSPEQAHLYYDGGCGYALSSYLLLAGSFNDLATAYMAFPDRTISHLFSLGSLTPQVLPQCACQLEPAALPLEHFHPDDVNDYTRAILSCGILLQEI